VIDMQFECVIPTSSQIETLYIQLKERTHSISHKRMPSYKEHESFVKNHPYRQWFIVKNAVRALGNVYIQYNNSVGLNIDYSVTDGQIYNILKFVYREIPPLPAIPSKRFGEFFLNVPSSNMTLQRKLSKLGFIEVERTFVLSKTDLLNLKVKA
jgi:hypothetical protein